ncbi:hypothetical protein BDN72DRAFT_846029 [Pluteus cervinus]|uniref:Uncharacterized protein n=1 Tax=Pluteus cervinus TaxID=181527 RepID=A0ACD3AGT2_9AGAR|nr:hypothetical protein BDN72DRAFT_846029 [Pluteus cervinus]
MLSPSSNLGDSEVNDTDGFDRIVYGLDHHVVITVLSVSVSLRHRAFGESNNAMSFIDLPRDIIDFTLDGCDDKTILALSSTCKVCREYLEGQIFSHLVFDFWGEESRVRSKIQFLEYLANGTSRISGCATSVEVWSLSKLYEVFPGDEGIDYKLLLQTAFSSLYNVQEVNWYVQSRVNMTEMAIVRAIRHLASGNPDIVVTIVAGRPPIALLECLAPVCPTAFVAVWTDRSDYPRCLNQLNYNSSPGMRSFTFTDSTWGASRKRIIRAMGTLSYWHAVPCFRKLEALRFEGLPQNVIDEVLCQAPFWRLMQDYQCHLKLLCLPFMVEPLLDYLASYCGLKYFDLQISDRNSQAIESTLVSRFYAEVLYAQADSLETLIMDIDEDQYYGPWALQASHIDGLSQCRKLQKLALPVLPPIDHEGIQKILSLLSLRTRIPTLYQLSMMGRSIPNVVIQESIEDIVRRYKPTEVHLTALETRSTCFKIQTDALYYY